MTPGKAFTLEGFDVAVWSVVVLNSFGGPLIGMIVRLFDIVVKDVAQCCAIVFTCLMGFLMLGEQIPPYFWSGGAAVALGTYVYGSSPKVVAYFESRGTGFESLFGGSVIFGSSGADSPNDDDKKGRERTILLWVGAIVSALVILPSLLRMLGINGLDARVDDEPYLRISQGVS